MAQVVKNLPAVLKIRVHSLGWEDPPKKEVATHSGILALRNQQKKEPGRQPSMGSQRVRRD